MFRIWLAICFLPKVLQFILRMQTCILEPLTQPATDLAIRTSSSMKGEQKTKDAVSRRELVPLC